MIFELLRMATTALEENGMSYMLSGSLAMNVYTVPRMTRDIDIVVHLEKSDVDTILQIFKDGYYFSTDAIHEAIRTDGMFNIIDFKSGQKIDFIIRKKTEFHLNEFNRRRKIDAYGFPMWIVSVEDLVISKLIWIQELQSDTQMRDIGNLMDVDEFDKDYVSHWVKNLNLNTFDLL